MHFGKRNASIGLMGIYTRTIGGIQVLYASFFGWLAYLCLGWTIQQMIWIAQDGFSFKDKITKGGFVAALDVGNFAEGTALALVFLSGLMGGCGLLGLRPWARRWEIAYLILVSGFALAVMTAETKRGHDIGYLVLAYAVLALPYLPFVLISPPTCRFPLFRDETKAMRILDDLDGL